MIKCYLCLILNGKFVGCVDVRSVVEVVRVMGYMVFVWVIYEGGDMICFVWEVLCDYMDDLIDVLVSVGGDGMIYEVVDGVF